MGTYEKMSDEQLRSYINDLATKSRAAQEQYERNYTTQRSIDEVVRAIGKAVCDNCRELCEDAVAETGMGNLQDKMNKLKAVALLQWTQTRGRNSVDYEDCPDEPGVKYLPKPMGVIGCVMPSTNPVATIIGNAMMALKGRNSVIIAPHPASVKVSDKTVTIMRNALKEIDTPVDLVQCISVEAASLEATTMLLQVCDCNVATGGAAMVKAVYSAGKPAFGVGQGNCQEIVDRGLTDSDVEHLAKRSIDNRSADNGVPCGGDQTLHIPVEFLDRFLERMRVHGAYVIDDDETIAKLRELIFPNGEPRINREVVGKLPYQIGEMAGIDISKTARVLLVKNQAWGDQDLLCREILCPIMRYTTYEVFEDAVDRAIANLKVEGAGHSSSIWSHDEKHIEYAARRIPVGRFHINQPTAGYNNGVTKTITVGCGTWGGGFPSENLTYRHLLNKTRVSVELPKVKSFFDASWDDFEPYSIVAD